MSECSNCDESGPQAALRCVADVLTDIRNDWEDPRFEIRAGRDAIENVAAGLKTEQEWRDQWSYNHGWKEEL